MILFCAMAWLKTSEFRSSPKSASNSLGVCRRSIGYEMRMHTRCQVFPEGAECRQSSFGLRSAPFSSSCSLGFSVCFFRCRRRDTPTSSQKSGRVGQNPKELPRLGAADLSTLEKERKPLHEPVEPPFIMKTIPIAYIVVPPKDVASLTEALKHGLDRPWDRSAISTWDRSRTWTDVAREVIDIQRALAGVDSTAVAEPTLYHHVRH
jgi:hypothetical protein